MGQVVSIYIAPARTAPMQRVDAVRAVPGRGLEGDRYFMQDGTFSDNPGPRREVTLIDEEAIETLRETHGITLPPAETRRNILTRGVALETLIGQEFRIGEVTLRGVDHCPPCSHLAGLTSEAISTALEGRGGLRAQILAGGTIREGDKILKQGA